MVQFRRARWGILALAATFSGCGSCFGIGEITCAVPPPCVEGGPSDCSMVPTVCTVSFASDSDVVGLASGRRAGAAADVTSCPGGCRLARVAEGASWVVVAYGPLRAGAGVASSDAAVARVDTVEVWTDPRCPPAAPLVDEVWTRLAAGRSGTATITYSDADGTFGTVPIVVEAPTALALGLDVWGRLPTTPADPPVASPAMLSVSVGGSTEAVWVQAVDAAGHLLVVGTATTLSIDDPSVATLTQPPGEHALGPADPVLSGASATAHVPWAQLRGVAAGHTTLRATALGLSLSVPVVVSAPPARDAGPADAGSTDASDDSSIGDAGSTDASDDSSIGDASDSG